MLSRSCSLVAHHAIEVTSSLYHVCGSSHATENLGENPVAPLADPSMEMQKSSEKAIQHGRHAFVQVTLLEHTSGRKTPVVPTLRTVRSDNQERDDSPRHRHLVDIVAEAESRIRGDDQPLAVREVTVSVLHAVCAPTYPNFVKLVLEVTKRAATP